VVWVLIRSLGVLVLTGCVATQTPFAGGAMRHSNKSPLVPPSVMNSDHAATEHLDRKFELLNSRIMQRTSCIDAIDGVLRQFQSALDDAANLKSYPVFDRIVSFSDALDSKRTYCRDSESEGYLISQIIYLNIMTRRFDRVEKDYLYIRTRYPDSFYARDDQVWVRLFSSCRNNESALESLALFELAWRLSDKDRQFDGYMDALEAGCPSISDYISRKLSPARPIAT